jgi:hypothetical protein
MLRCASSFVIAAYVYVLFIPQDLRALPQPAPAKAGGAFYEAVEYDHFLRFFYKVINFRKMD